MATNDRKIYFHIDKMLVVNKYGLLDDVESVDENGIDNLMNDSDIKFIAEEEITQAASIQDTSLTTPEADLHVVKTNSQSKKKEKNNKEELWKWTKKGKVAKQEECHLVLEIKSNLNETVEISYLVTGFEELLELIVEQSNLYSHQNGRNFTVTKKKLKACFGMNFVTEINKLPTIPKYWRVDNLIGNDGIQNTMICNCFCEVLQNLHFADNRQRTIKQTTLSR